MSVYIHIHIHIHIFKKVVHERVWDDKIYTIVRNEIFVCSSRLAMYIHENMCILIYMYEQKYVRVEEAIAT